MGITLTADTLVRASTSGDPLSSTEMASSLTNLVDALALLGNVSLDINQRRRDDQRGDINNAYKGLCKDGADGSALLYGDNLSTRIFTSITNYKCSKTELGGLSLPSVTF